MEVPSRAQGQILGRMFWGRSPPEAVSYFVPSDVKNGNICINCKKFHKNTWPMFVRDSTVCT